MNRPQSYREQQPYRPSQNKSDLILESNPFQDISNLKQNRSSVFLKEKQAAKKRQSITEKSKPKPLIQNEDLISLKFRIALNEFSEDYYIFNLQLKPQIQLNDLEAFFMEYPPLEKIRAKIKAHHSKFTQNKQSNQGQLTIKFFFLNQQLQPDMDVKKIQQSLEQSNKKVDYIDFSFEWIRQHLKQTQNRPLQRKRSKVLATQQNCCILM